MTEDTTPEVIAKARADDSAHDRGFDNAEHQHRWEQDSEAMKNGRLPSWVSRDAREYEPEMRLLCGFDG